MSNTDSFVARCPYNGEWRPWRFSFAHHSQSMSASLLPRSHRRRAIHMHIFLDIFFHSFLLCQHRHGSEPKERAEREKKKCRRYCWFSPMRCIYITLLQQTYARLKKIYVVPASALCVFIANFGADWLFGAVNKTARRTRAGQPYKHTNNGTKSSPQWERPSESEWDRARAVHVHIMNGHRVDAMETVLPFIRLQWPPTHCTALNGPMNLA